MLVREALRTCPIAADVLIAYDGEQALRMLTELQFKPDFIVMDLSLPKFSGLVLLERFRELGGEPVIVFSASVNEADQARAMELGAREYVTKPPVFNDFVAAVHGMVERWATRAQSA